MGAVCRSVADFNAQERSMLEGLLGKPLEDTESLRIEIVPPVVRTRPPRTRPPVTGVPKAGEYAGRLVVPDDFDEPLEDLSEYMA